MMKRLFYILLALLAVMLVPSAWVCIQVGIPTMTTNGLQWRNVQRMGHTASRVHLNWDRSVVIEGTSIDLQGLNVPSSTDSNASTVSWKEWIPSIEVRNVKVRYSDDLTVTLEGQIHPALQMRNDWLSIQKEEDGWTVVAELSHETLGDIVHIDDNTWSATATLRAISLHDSWTGTIDSIRFSHPILGTHIRIPSLETTLNRSMDGWQARLKTTDSQIDVRESTNQEWRVEMDIASQDLVTWFNVDIPNTSTKGHWILKATPSRTTLSMEELGFEGQIYGIHRLQTGTPITYQPIHSNQTRLLGPNLPTWVPYDDLGWTAMAVIAAEDAPFMTHNGFNLEGLNRAITEIREHPDNPIGGSSITQQVAKNLFTGNRSTLQRKIEEMVYTLALEQALSKRAILALYLNAIEFGDQIYGLQQAAELYFMKTPKNLSIKEAVFLASILPNPREGYRRAKMGRPPTRRMRAILQNLLDGKQITRSQKNAAEREELRLLMPVE